MINIIQTHSNIGFIQKVCETIKEQANESIKEKGSFTFVLSGGRTPKNIFIELAKNYQNSIVWSKVHFFWLDERCVEPSHEDSNYKLAYDHLISKIDYVGSVHRIKGELEPDQAAQEYEEGIKEFFGANEVKFDFILLGMGEDGHIASLFPNSKELKLTNHIAFASEKQYHGHRRVTLGLEIINNSSIFLIINNKKYNIYKKKELKLPCHMLKDEVYIIREIDV